MRAITAILLLIALPACTPRSRTVQVPRDAPAVVFTDMRRPDDPAFSAKERTIIDSSRRYLQRTRRPPLDAYYSLSRTARGYEVHVQYVAVYEGGKPLFAPGGHGYVELREDGSIIRYEPGD